MVSVKVPNISPVAIAHCSTIVAVVPSWINPYWPAWYAEPCVITTSTTAARYVDADNVATVVALVPETLVSDSEGIPDILVKLEPSPTKPPAALQIILYNYINKNRKKFSKIFFHKYPESR